MMNQPPQQQQPPGTTPELTPQPRDTMADYAGRDLLRGRQCLITGGDSGIGRAVAVAFAKEGADVALAYLEEHSDAETTAELVREQGRRAMLLPGDLASAEHCREVVERTVTELGGLSVVVNNVATQEELDKPEDLTAEK